jgi:hypothetical protein
MTQEHFAISDAAIAATGWTVTKGGALMTGISWLLSSQGVGLIGICGVLVGLWLQWHFGRRRDRREEGQDRRDKDEHELRMHQLDEDDK